MAWLEPSHPLGGLGSFLSLQLFNFVFQPIPFYKQFLWVFITIYFLQVLFMVQDASPSLLSADVAVAIAERCSTNWPKTVDFLFFNCFYNLRDIVVIKIRF